jgi:hypothetical protein
MVNAETHLASRKFLRHSVRSVAAQKAALQEEIRDRQYPHELIPTMDWICGTCLEAVKLGKRSTLEADGEGLGPPSLPKIPEQLRGLSKVENLLISAVVPFQRLQQRPSGGQVAIKGLW